MALELPGDIYCGLYPTGRFEASIQLKASGALVLINTGLLDLISFATALAIGASAFTIVDAGGSDSSIDVPALITVDEARSRLSGILRRLLGQFEMTSRNVEEHYELLAMFEESREKLFNSVIISTVNSVIAHELAHYLAGGFGKEQSEASELHMLARDRQAELNADRLGACLVTGPPIRDQNGQPIVDSELPYSGIVVFNQLVALLTNYSNPDGFPFHAATHANPRVRLSAAISGVHPRGLYAELPECDALYRSFDAIRGIAPIKRDIEALKTLANYELKSKAVDEMVDLLYQKDVIAEGLVRFDLWRLVELMRGNMRSAAAVVARGAREYLRRSLVVNHRHAELLATAHVAFMIGHMADGGSPHASTFRSIVRASVPEIDELIDRSIGHAISDPSPGAIREDEAHHGRRYRRSTIGLSSRRGHVR